VARTCIRAETQIHRWYRLSDGLYLLALKAGAGVAVARQAFRDLQIDGLDLIPEREASEKEARMIWGCPPLESPSRWEVLMGDDEVPLPGP